MTTTFTSTGPAPVSPRASFVPAGSGLSAVGILRSEWIKVRSLRSTAWSFALVVLISLGMATVMSFSLDVQGEAVPASEQASYLVMASTFGVFFGQLVVAVLGVLVISGEYTTGMIRSTLTAVPRRLGALWGKAVVLFLATFLVGAIASIGSFLVASPILAGEGIHGSLLDSNIILPLLGSALYLALVAVFSLGLGAILRSSAGGIAAALGVILLLPIVFQMIPAEWAYNVLPYLISNSGMAIFGLADYGVLELWQNLLVTLGWVTVSVAAAAVLLKRRDA